MCGSSQVGMIFKIVALLQVRLRAGGIVSTTSALDPLARSGRSNLISSSGRLNVCCRDPELTG